MIVQNEVALKSGYQVCQCSYAAALIFTDNINHD